MKRKQFSENRIIGILKEGEAGAAVKKLCRKHRMSSAAHCAWNSKVDVLEVFEAKRLRASEDENVKLKRLAETMLNMRSSKVCCHKNGNA